MSDSTRAKGHPPYSAQELFKVLAGADFDPCTTAPLSSCAFGAASSLVSFLCCWLSRLAILFSKNNSMPSLWYSQNKKIGEQINQVSNYNGKSSIYEYYISNKHMSTKANKGLLHVRLKGRAIEDYQDISINDAKRRRIDFALNYQLALYLTLLKFRIGAFTLHC